MSYHKVTQGIPSGDDGDLPRISPVSPMDLDDDGETPRRMTSTGRLGTVPESDAYRWQHGGTEVPITNTTHEASTNSNTSHESLDRNSYHDNPFGISHQSSQCDIRRVPVPTNEASVAGASPAPDLKQMETPSGMPSPNETLVGGYSPRRVSRWERLWRFSTKSFNRKGSDIDTASLTMNMQPIAGSGSPAAAEETAHDSKLLGSDSPTPGCDNDSEPCSSRKNISHSIKKVVVCVALYSTVMSALWLAVAIWQPRWGSSISSNNGELGPSTATVLSALLSKSIELSFVATFITFMGQKLTRKAFSRRSGGTTLAELSMSNWVNQPGSLLTRPSLLRYAILSALGVLSVLATLVAAFYTTASDAMVAPKLKLGDWEHKVIQGTVRTSYANSQFVKDSCATMLASYDPGATTSCTDVMISGESYRNLQAFMSVWAEINTNGSSLIRDLNGRPAGVASFNGNTTLYGSWIETEHSNVTAHFEETGRIINNVTLAMPHPGVALAAKNPVNNILQPHALSGVGEYAIRAGVVSPALNVMCVNMSPDELDPLVYTSWPNANFSTTGTGNQTIGWQNWTIDVPLAVDSQGKDNWLNATVVDDIFRWGPKYKRRPPAFKLFPANYNTVVNSSVPFSDAIYILGKSPELANYTLCELRSWQTPKCSTYFNISGITGSKMSAHCEDPNDLDSYSRSFPEDQSWPPPSQDWRWLGDQWRQASDLNGGERNSDPANSRILTQLALREPKLLTYMPSMAEAIAVFASPTLVLGSTGAPFLHYWKYDKPGNIIQGELQGFNASVVTQQYTSSHIYEWQGIFYAILGLALAINLVCSVYIFVYRNFVTDYTETRNLFTLALNSAPNQLLRGTCGGGPENEDLSVPWRVSYSTRTNHYFIERTEGGGSNDNRAKGGHAGESYERLCNASQWV